MIRGGGGGGLLILEDIFFNAYSRTDTGACSVIRTTTGFELISVFTSFFFGRGGGWWATDLRGFLLHCILKD